MASDDARTALVPAALPVFRICQLPAQTDLNALPPNWPAGTLTPSLERLVPRPQRSVQPSAPAPLPERFELASSAILAHDEATTAHFVGSAETFKRLVKLPFSHAAVSVPIHRVGMALVIDGDPIETRKPSTRPYAARIGGGGAEADSLGARRKSALGAQEQLLYSKFVHHSLASQPGAEAGAEADATAVGASASELSAALPPSEPPASGHKRLAPGCDDERVPRLPGGGVGETRWTFWEPPTQPESAAGPLGAASSAQRPADERRAGQAARREGAGGAAPADATGTASVSQLAVWRALNTDSPAAVAAAASVGHAAAELGPDSPLSNSPVASAAMSSLTLALGGASAARTSAQPARANSTACLSAACAGTSVDADARAEPEAAADARPRAQQFMAELGKGGFSRLVRWQVRGWQLLLGSDTLVFGNAQHAAVTLQLCDLEREITPTTCLDFWLDNLMAGVPEVAVCGHRGGIVSGYKVMKTEDVPYWPCQYGFAPAFDADEVNECAAQLFAFLQAHCVEEGSSYQLVKEEGADTIHLFQTRSLQASAGAGPFAFAVGMMAFRLATTFKARARADAGAAAAAGAGAAGAARARAGALARSSQRALLHTASRVFQGGVHPLMHSLAAAELAHARAPPHALELSGARGDAGAAGGVGGALALRAAPAAPAASATPDGDDERADGEGGWRAGARALLDALGAALGPARDGAAATEGPAAEAATAGAPPAAAQLVDAQVEALYHLASACASAVAARSSEPSPLLHLPALLDCHVSYLCADVCAAAATLAATVRDACARGGAERDARAAALRACGALARAALDAQADLDPLMPQPARPRFGATRARDGGGWVDGLAFASDLAQLVGRVSAERVRGRAPGDEGAGGARDERARARARGAGSESALGAFAACADELSATCRDLGSLLLRTPSEGARAAAGGSGGGGGGAAATAAEAERAAVEWLSALLPALPAAADGDAARPPPPHDAADGDAAGAAQAAACALARSLDAAVHLARAHADAAAAPAKGAGGADATAQARADGVVARCRQLADLCNERGKAFLAAGALPDGEAWLARAHALFEAVRDRPNACLVLLNIAALWRARAKTLARGAMLSAPWAAGGGDGGAASALSEEALALAASYVDEALRCLEAAADALGGARAARGPLAPLWVVARRELGCAFAELGALHATRARALGALGKPAAVVVRAVRAALDFYEGALRASDEAAPADAAAALGAATAALQLGGLHSYEMSQMLATHGGRALGDEATVEGLLAPARADASARARATLAVRHLQRAAADASALAADPLRAPGVRTEARRIATSAHLKLAQHHEAVALEAAAAGDPVAQQLRHCSCAVEAAESAMAVARDALANDDELARAHILPIVRSAHQAVLRRALGAHAKAGSSARAEALKAAYRESLAAQTAGADPSLVTTV
jgi:hypothetical protein